MSFQLMVIEDDDTPTDSSVCAALGGDAEFRCQRRTWDAFAAERVSDTRVSAIVAVAVPRTPKAMSVFESMYRHPVATPALLVLPSDAADPLLRRAAETADDFVVSPLRGNELRQRLARVVGKEPQDLDDVRHRLRAELGLEQLVGNDATFLRVIEQLPRLARMELPILITGETGTGKELCARAIHHLGRRQNGPFIAVDCGAVPDHLMENELFGHARGAFTDAHRDQRGLIALAEKGTLFLDEIDSLSLSAQVKLLRFLQERSFRPLGAEKFQHADVNVIAATNRDLEASVRGKEFRSDLYHRLNVLSLHLPPLRERLGDLAPLATHFLRERHARTQDGPRLFSAGALRLLFQYHWPGNVRELANCVYRAIAACDEPQVLAHHIALPRQSVVEAAPRTFRAARAFAVAAFERCYVEELLRKHCGNVTHAARDAQKDRRAFGRLIKKYDIERAKK